MLVLAMIAAVQDTTPDVATIPKLTADWLAQAGRPPYPPDAFRNGQEGVAQIDLRIDSDGRVQGCTLVGTSGVPSLDEASCPYAYRIRFTPAHDASGAAVESDTVFPMRWVLPPRYVSPAPTR